MRFRRQRERLSPRTAAWSGIETMHPRAACFQREHGAFVVPHGDARKCVAAAKAGLPSPTISGRTNGEAPYGLLAGCRRTRFAQEVVEETLRPRNCRSIPLSMPRARTCPPGRRNAPEECPALPGSVGVPTRRSAESGRPPDPADRRLARARRPTSRHAGRPRPAARAASEALDQLNRPDGNPQPAKQNPDLRGRFGAQQIRQQCHRIMGASGSSSMGVIVGGTVCARDQLIERVAGTHRLVTAHTTGNPASRAGRPGVEPRQPVGPLHVVDGDQHRRAYGELLEQRADPVDEPQRSVVQRGEAGECVAR